MESTDHFKIFITDLAKGEESARAIEHIGIIVRNWCRKNKLELKWIVSGNRILENDELYYKMYLKALATIRKGGIKTYSDYKRLVLTLAEEMLTKGFEEFNTLLINKNNLSWKLAEEQLKVYALKWYKTRNISTDLDIHDLHWSAMHVLFEKLFQKKLSFRNSYELKSYYFRILENKMKEQFRKNKKEQLMSHKIPELSYETQDSGKDERLEVVKQEIKKLADNEQFIIREYFFCERKLTDIAKKLNISPENCRVIKHRAMKRLMEKIPGRTKLYSSYQFSNHETQAPSD